MGFELRLELTQFMAGNLLDFDAPAAGTEYGTPT